MIRGEALNFESNMSGKIVLARRADPLTNKQKEIGSSAMFGVVDALALDKTDNLRRFSFEFLRDYFLNMERDLLTLLNHPIVEFAPGYHFERAVEEDAYSVINGTVRFVPNTTFIT